MLGISLDAELRRNDQDFRRRAHDRYRRQILEYVKRQRFLQGRIDDDCRIHDGDVVAIGLRVSDVIDADNAAGAGTIIGNDGLIERGADLLRQDAAGEIDDAARTIGNDQMNGPSG